MKIRKAILTGGGRATRLYPVTTTINKHLLPLANKPMIFHAIEKMVEAGIEEIFINTNSGEVELQKYIGDGGHWGVKITFFEQTGGPKGIAHVVHLAKDFIGSDPFIFFLSDNIFLGSITHVIDEFHANKYDCMLVFSKVSDPERFGVPVFDNEGILVDILEKPQEPPNNFAQTGLYVYGPNIFFSAFDKITPSARGEYEISDVHSYLLKHGFRVGHKEITGYWKDTGKAQDLLFANELLLDRLEEKKQISREAHIGENVIFHEPVIIGEHCVLENCEIGPYVTIGSGTEIEGAKIERTIILEHATINCDIHITDSLIGKGVHIRKKTSEEKKGHSMVIGENTIIEL